MSDKSGSEVDKKRIFFFNFLSVNVPAAAAVTAKLSFFIMFYPWSKLDHLGVPSLSLWNLKESLFFKKRGSELQEMSCF